MTEKIEWSAEIKVKYDGIDCKFDELTDDIQQQILDAIVDSGLPCADTIEIDAEEPRDPMLDYVKSHLEKWQFDKGWAEIGRREPISDSLSQTIYDLCEEWCEDNDLPEGSWLNTYDGTDDIFTQL